MIAFLGFMFWFVCGILGYGLTLAYFSSIYSNKKVSIADRFVALIVGLSGPMGLLQTYVFSGFGKHGLKFL